MKQDIRSASVMNVKCFIDRVKANVNAKSGLYRTIRLNKKSLLRTTIYVLLKKKESTCTALLRCKLFEKQNLCLLCFII